MEDIGWQKKQGIALHNTYFILACRFICDIKLKAIIDLLIILLTCTYLLKKIHHQCSFI